MVYWSTKAAISLKRVKIEKKLPCAHVMPIGTHQRMVPSSTSYGLIFPKVGSSQSPPKTSIANISGTGKATNFTSNFVRSFIDRFEQRPIKNFGKSAQGLSKILKAPTYRAHRAVIFAVAQLSCCISLEV